MTNRRFVLREIFAAISIEFHDYLVLPASFLSNLYSFAVLDDISMNSSVMGSLRYQLGKILVLLCLAVATAQDYSRHGQYKKSFSRY